MRFFFSAFVFLTLAVSIVWAAPNIDGAPLKGEVLETADGGSYIYLKLKTAQGDIWAATMKQAIAPGTRIVIHDPMLMTDFNSKALNRTFDQIVFASAISVEGSASPSPMAQMAAAHKGAAAPVVNAPVEKVAKATGTNAKTVAEVYAQKSQLKDKPVVVRARVVKFSADIMSRNWVHLRDGSGSTVDRSHDLLVTTKQTVKVGDVVVATGLVKTDVDYGSGYSYPVVINDAKLN